MSEKDETIKTGLQIFACVGVFFLIIYFLGLGEITELRYFNIAIVIFFTNRLAKKNARKREGNGYLQNLFSLFAANAVSVILSILGFVAFILLYDPHYLETLSSSFLWGGDLNLVAACLGLLLEGMAGAAVMSFSVMQYWKNVKLIA